MEITEKTQSSSIEELNPQLTEQGRLERALGAKGPLKPIELSGRGEAGVNA